MSIAMKPDQERVHALLVDTLTLLCKNGLNFQKGLKVEGVIGITVDEKDVFIVHINKLLQNDGRERCATFQDTDAPVKAELAKHISLGKKGKRRLSKDHQTDESSDDDVNPEIATDGTGFSSLDSNENYPYNAVSFDSAECKDGLRGLESSENKVIFVKSEGSEFVDSYEESSIPLATSLSYSEIPVSESLAASNLQFQRSKTARHVRRPEQNLNENPIAISHNYQCFPADELADIDSNFATESTFQYKQEDDDPNSSEICSQNLNNNPYNQPSETGRRFTAARKRSCYSWYPPVQNSGFRNRNLTTGYSLQRKMEGEHFQVMSRFLCNFSNCNLSFSTKQNLLRHQTQKHGRQKSRTGHARRFSTNSDGRFCEGV